MLKIFCKTNTNTFFNYEIHIPIGAPLLDEEEAVLQLSEVAVQYYFEAGKMRT